ncbi:MAG: helix-turn-helix domain-containing protein [Selenomonadaceae bacterium]
MYYEFGEILRNARKARGWTQIQASAKVNELCQKRESIASVYSLDKWERGEVLPRLESIVALSRAYSRPDLIAARIKAIELAKRKNPHELALTRI